MSRIYVSDTNIWIDFRNAGLLNELFQLPFTLCCTEFVISELQDLQCEVLIQRGLQVEQLDGDVIARLNTLMQAHNNSSLADVSCYLLAKESGRPLLTGDGQLRKQAVRDNLEVYGALWLLDKLVEHSIVQAHQAAESLRQMLQHGARFPPEACKSRLDLWSQ
jgi:predicted nucleic acid-binding protein